jgi:hypothetical protein
MANFSGGILLSLLHTLMPFSNEEDLMLVMFKTDAYPNITMFGDDAIAMLKMMGHSGTVPGSIRTEDVAHALGQLTDALATGQLLPQANTKDANEPVVSTAHRGAPLVELLTAAVKANDYVMWEKSTIIT